MAFSGTRAQQPSRPRLLQAMIDSWSQEDVRSKLMFVFAMLIVFRFVAHIPIPGVNPDLLDQAFEGNNSTSAFLGTLNIFSGGALRQLSVAALGVYPYITASIIMNILTPMIPSLQALSREGEQGRNRIQLYTHWIAVPLAVVQGYSQLLILQQLGAVQNIGFSGPNALPTFAAVISMAAGTMFLVWLGELITEKGIGNGISLIIFGGIVAGIPSLLPNIFDSSVSFFGIILLAIIVLVAVSSIVFFQEAQRRIPVQYSRTQFRGGRQYRQQGSTHIPLRILSAGMIPIIFAYSIMLVPSFMGETLATSSDNLTNDIGNFLTDVFGQQNLPYYLVVFLFVVLFTYFYTLVTYAQQNLAENLQKQGGFVPGIRPGKPTNDYITRVLVRITAAGAIFLGVIAVMPFFATRLTDVQALTISGTGLLIVVGVVLDTMKQLEAQLMMRNYSGFIR
ncbi:MAG TPA: preprotein translocase subunit SecY [Dehalococcoidia bacterium]|jgi:preprotein translocase subunit SecY|nr:preprotein translocase subunit SecY [Dehalococcoidia bacterium]